MAYPKIFQHFNLQDREESNSNLGKERSINLGKERSINLVSNLTFYLQVRLLLTSFPFMSTLFTTFVLHHWLSSLPILGNLPTDFISMVFSFSLDFLAPSPSAVRITPGTPVFLLLPFWLCFSRVPSHRERRRHKNVAEYICSWSYVPSMKNC